MVASLMVKEWCLLEEVSKSDFKLEVDNLSRVLATLRLEPEIIQRIKILQQTNPEISKV